MSRKLHQFLLLYNLHGSTCYSARPLTNALVLQSEITLKPCEICAESQHQATYIHEQHNFNHVMFIQWLKHFFSLDMRCHFKCDFIRSPSLSKEFLISWWFFFLSFFLVFSSVSFSTSQTISIQQNKYSIGVGSLIPAFFFALVFHIKELHFYGLKTFVFIIRGMGSVRFPYSRRSQEY